MKLISKFKNYYDHCIYSFGVDPLVIWNREPKKLSIVEYCKREKPNLYSRAKELSKKTGNIERLLMGELLPVTKFGNIAVIVVNDKVYYYAYLKLNTLDKNNIYPDGFCSVSDMVNSRAKNEAVPFGCEEIFAKGKLGDAEWVELRKFFKTPMLVYGHQVMKCSSNGFFDKDLSNSYFVESGLFSNPDISQYPLSRDIGPMDVYKNVLAAFCCDMEVEDQKPQPENTRIEAAGFDLKQSFRKRKS